MNEPEAQSPLALRVGRAILAALDPDEQLTSEELNVLLWRFSQLDRDGYGVEDAMAMARARHVDLKLAHRLVSNLGCPPALAAQILL